MNHNLALSLSTLPSLARANARSAAVCCKVCDSPAEFFDVTDFWKGSAFFRFGPSRISVQYYRCEACGFMFTPLFDDWTPDDFRRHIYNDEYVLVDPEYSAIRPRRLAEHLSKWLAGFEDARILDYGSGTGLFTRQMRDAGFKYVTNFDPFSEPVRPSGQFDIVTCFEVIEHSPTPLQTMRDLVSFLNEDACIILGECLQPPDIAYVRCNWWYCMPRNGHISFYTDRTLALLATHSELRFHPGEGIHAFSRRAEGKYADLARRISPPLFPVSLSAPKMADSESSKACWHGVERFSGVPTRWTAVPNVSWRVAVPSSRSLVARIRVPFVAEVRPGFAAESRLLFDGSEAKTSIADRSIVAEFRVEERSSIEVTLQTPPVISPSKLKGGPDLRELGLAIPCLAGDS